jgi:catechol 2,3-dioxygenase-like lactoylglutathione lyase family enzyme
VNVTDLGQAKAYYDQFMPLVDYEPFFAVEDQFSYLPANQKRGTWVFFYEAAEPTDYSRQRPGLQHLAFMVDTRRAVDEAHEWAIAAGSEILHAPREFPEYHEGYYATFWLDPEGFMLEIVCHQDKNQDAG